MTVKKQPIERVTGIITETLPNTLFRVKLNGQENDTLCYLAGKMRLHRIRVLIGDRVEVELEPYGGKAKIVKRL